MITYKGSVGVRGGPTEPETPHGVLVIHDEGEVLHRRSEEDQLNYIRSMIHIHTNILTFKAFSNNFKQDIVQSIDLYIVEVDGKMEM